MIMRLARLLPLSVVLLLVSCFSAEAQQPPVLIHEDEQAVDAGAPDGSAQRERIDARLLANTDDKEPPSPEQIGALDEISRRVDGRVRADFNPLNGTLRLLFARGSFLSEPSLDPPRAVARDFLLDQADLFALSPEFASGLIESRVFKNENNGITHVQYEQQYEGLKVFQSTVRIAVTAEGRVLTVTADYYPELSLPSTAPALSKEEAMEAAFGEVGPPLDLPPLESDPGPLTASVRDLYVPTAELVVFPLPHKSAALAWRVGVPQFVNLWDVVVDANSGAVLYVDNLTKDDAEGQVFLEHPDAGAQVTEPFVGPLPSPRDAWVGANSVIPTCATCTSGNNVTAVSDRNGDDYVSLPSNPDAHFNFGFANSWALTGNPDADELTSITNLFYLNNVAHDHFYQLGFTEAAGNFQDDNFGAGGVDEDEDPVVAYTYWGYDDCPLAPPPDACRNNAFFMTRLDGLTSFMVMFLFTSPRRDPSFDGDVVIHEYSHGVSTRLVGVGQLSGTQSGAMGEGWSDYFPISLYNDPVAGEYVTGNASTGIRRYAYDNSPLTYGDLCTGPYDCEVHDDGEIWAVALWDLRAFYVSQLGLAAGQEAADELVVEGLMLTPTSPSMLDGRDAILQAELAAGGVDQCGVWQVFADRGMGYSATSAGDTGVVTEAFDLPAACDSDGDDVWDGADNCPDDYNPGQEDNESDGIGDVCDDDDDNDTVLDVDDDDPFDQYVCQDVDTDTCDDCTVTGGPPDTANDGPDNEPDGLCDAGDPDDDNDLMLDTYEDAYACLDPLLADGMENPDGDELRNYPEMIVATDPCVDNPELTDDTDGDGGSDGRERYIGTDRLDDCTNDGSPEERGTHDAWHFDINIDTWSNILDVLLYKGQLQAQYPEPEYNSRLDFNADGWVDILDILLYKGDLQIQCTNP